MRRQQHHSGTGRTAHPRNGGGPAHGTHAPSLKFAKTAAHYNAAMDKVIGDFIFFFTVIDPIGTVPVFIAATAAMPERVRRLVAIRAALISIGLLIA